MSKQELEVKQSMDRKAVVALLEDLMSSLKAGTVHLEYGDREALLEIGDTLEVSLEASQKKAKGKLNLEIAWKQVDEEKKETASLKISSVTSLASKKGKSGNGQKAAAAE